MSRGQTRAGYLTLLLTSMQCKKPRNSFMGATRRSTQTLLFARDGVFINPTSSDWPVLRPRLLSGRKHFSGHSICGRRSNFVKEEHQIEAIAKFCGWKNIIDIHGVLHGTAPNFRARAIPDYLTDLNAMHEAELRLDADQLAKYAHWLQVFVVGSGRISQCTTAAERAQAFLRTLNLWEAA